MPLEDYTDEELGDAVAAAIAAVRKEARRVIAERDRFAHIAATIRVNGLRNGATEAEIEALIRGEKDFVGWLADRVEGASSQRAREASAMIADESAAQCDEDTPGGYCAAQQARSIAAEIRATKSVDVTSIAYNAGVEDAARYIEEHLLRTDGDAEHGLIMWKHKDALLDVGNRARAAGVRSLKRKRT